MTVLTLGASAVYRDAAFTYAVLFHVVAYVPKVVAGALLLALDPRQIVETKP